MIVALIDLTRLSQAVSEIKEHCLNTFALIVHSHSPASPSTSGSGGYAGFMSATDKEKLDGIDAGANDYTLPAATSSTLGGVKPDGTTVTVDADGTIHGANSYTLPTMGANTKGGAKLGAGLAVANDTLSLSGESYTSAEKTKLAGIESGANNYTLPIASTSTLGGIKPDGTSITIDSDGTIHGPGGGGGTVFGVKGDAETDYRTGNVNLTATDIGAAETTHYHTTLGDASTTVLSANISLCSVAEGIYTIPSGNASHAEGYHTTADGFADHAEGAYTTANGGYSHAEGSSSTASGWFSHVQNMGTTAVRKSQTVIGEYNTVDWEGTDPTVRGDYAVIIGNGTADNDRSNALAVRWNGLVDVAGANTAYPMFIWSTTPTNSDTFPVSPCFVYSTADNGLYYCTN